MICNVYKNNSIPNLSSTFIYLSIYLIARLSWGRLNNYSTETCLSNTVALAVNNLQFGLRRSILQSHFVQSSPYPIHSIIPKEQLGHGIIVVGIGYRDYNRRYSKDAIFIGLNGILIKKPRTIFFGKLGEGLSMI